MTNRAQMAIAVFAVGSLVVLASGFALGRATLLDSGLIRAQIAQKLTDWTGGTVKLTGPVRLAYLPSMTLDVQQVSIDDATRVPALDSIHAKALRIELSLWSLVSGSLLIDRVHWTEPQIRFATDRKAAATNPTPPIVDALKSAPFAAFSIEQGKALIVRDRDTEELTKVELDLALSDTGAMAGTGRMTWRGQPVDFSIESDDPVIVANTAKSQVDLLVSGPMVDGRLQGEASIADGAQISGKLELEVPDLRKFVNWMGLLVPEGRGLGKFTAEGSVNWASQKIAIDNGQFELDGNTASGALALQYATPRPAVEGTLALTDLRLSQYITRAPATATGKAEKSPATDLAFPLLHHFDADLRISTSELNAKPVSIGETALTVTMKSGVLAGEFAIFDMCGGKGNGRLELNAAKPRPQMQLSAAFEALKPENCIELFLPDSPIESANAGLTVKLSSAGATHGDLLKNLDGSLTINMQAGSINIDPLKIITAARKRALHGWKSVLGSPRNFESLSAEFRLGDGNAKSDSFKVVSGRTTMTGSGSIDIASRNIEWRLRVANETLGRASRFGNIVAELVDSLIIQGPLTEPTFRLERRQANVHQGVPRGAARVFLGTMH